MTEKMRTKAIKYFTIGIVSIIPWVFPECNHNEQGIKAVDDLNAYVKEHADSADKYIDKSWDELERKFDEKKAQVEKDTSGMNEDIRASYYKAVRDWNSFKEDFLKRVAEKRKLAEANSLRNSLTIEGVRSDYSDLTAGNILSEYRHFVNTVETHKDEYSKEQWTVINVSWKNLNGRKKEIAKDITKGDNKEITNLQLKYTSIKALNRPFSENS